MSQAKSRAKKAAPSKGGAASRAKKGKGKGPKSVDFRGMEIAVPDKVPGTLLFDFADLESGNELRGTMELLKSLVGVDAYQAIRNKIGAEDLDFEETEAALAQLMEDLFEKYGINLGE